MTITIPEDEVKNAIKEWLYRHGIHCRPDDIRLNYLNSTREKPAIVAEVSLQPLESDDGKGKQ